MITVTIKRITRENYTETKNFIVKSTPTEIRERDSYGNENKIKSVEEYETKEVQQSRTIERTLVNQEIEDESSFNLAAVLKAINNL